MSRRASIRLPRFPVAPFGNCLTNPSHAFNDALNCGLTPSPFNPSCFSLTSASTVHARGVNPPAVAFFLIAGGLAFVT